MCGERLSPTLCGSFWCASTTSPLRQARGAPEGGWGRRGGTRVAGPCPMGGGRHPKANRHLRRPLRRKRGPLPAPLVFGRGARRGGARRRRLCPLHRLGDTRALSLPGDNTRALSLPTHTRQYTTEPLENRLTFPLSSSVSVARPQPSVSTRKAWAVCSCCSYWGFGWLWSSARRSQHI